MQAVWKSVVHLREKKFVCQVCDKAFGRNASLTVHIKTVHQGHNEKICQLCQKTGFRSSHHGCTLKFVC